MSDEVDPVEEYLRPGRRRRALAATVVGLLGLTAAVAGAEWSRIEVPPSAPAVPAPVPVVQVPQAPPPPMAVPKARPRAPRPVLATTEPPARGAPPTATVRPRATRSTE